jgi:hypothetical protein
MVIERQRISQTEAVRSCRSGLWQGRQASSLEWIISIRRLFQYRSNLSDRAAADLAALDSDFVRRETSIFPLGKRCRRSEGTAREK